MKSNLPLLSRVLSILWAASCAGQVRAEGAPAVSTTSAQAGYRKGTWSYQAPDGQTRERTLFLWYPTAEEAKPYVYHFQKGRVALDAAVAGSRHPLLLFSHGYLGSGDQVVYLMEALARAGYIVASTNHADSLGERHPAQRLAAIGPPRFADVKAWDDRKFIDRKQDIEALLEYLLAQDREASSYLHEHVQADAIGVMGHSLGGYTALGLVGGWPSWKDERLRAALLLSPYSLPWIERMPAGSVKTPTMLQGGTRDRGITPLLPPIYEKLSAPKYFLVLKGQSHYAWTNLLTHGQDTVTAVESLGPAQLVADYSIAFFNHTLRHQEAPLLTQPNAELESYRYLER